MLEVLVNGVSLFVICGIAICYCYGWIQSSSKPLEIPEAKEVRSLTAQFLRLGSWTEKTSPYNDETTAPHSVKSCAKEKHFGKLRELRFVDYEGPAFSSPVARVLLA